MTGHQIREAIYSRTCDFCGSEKIDPENWIMFSIQSRQGYGLNVDMCDKCFNKMPDTMQDYLSPKK